MKDAGAGKSHRNNGAADEALLPAVYMEVGAALHATHSGLGSLTLLRSIVQSACFPLAIYMTTRHKRTQVIALGAFLWAAATFLLAILSSYFLGLGEVKTQEFGGVRVLSFFRERECFDELHKLEVRHLPIFSPKNQEQAYMHWTKFLKLFYRPLHAQ